MEDRHDEGGLRVSRFKPQQCRKGRSKRVLEFAEFNGNLSGQDALHWAGGYVKGGQSSGYIGVIPHEGAPDTIVQAWQVIVKDPETQDTTIVDGPDFRAKYTVITEENQ